jgi:tRNA-dihydrouridine synthase A
MAEPELVADCVSAMRDAVALPVTVKHRLGIDSMEDFDFVRRFVEVVSRAGCTTFIVHARNAMLKGLSPRDNRQIPPLRYEYAYRLKREFQRLEIVINGGLVEVAPTLAQLSQVDGVMLGRSAYHDSYVLALLDSNLFGAPAPSRREVVETMRQYATREVPLGTPLRAIARHMLGLYHGEPGARVWRRMLSDAQLLARNDPELLLDALSATETRQGSPAETV